MNIKANGCCICKSADVDTILKLYDDRYGFPGTFHLVACRQCGHKYLKESLDSDELDQIYTKYYPRSDLDPGKFRPHQVPGKFIDWLNGGMSSAFRWVPGGVRVLDIGCGWGEAVAYHSSRGCDAYGVDADKNVAKNAKKHELKIDIGLFTPERYPQNFFDYVTMGQVIEHSINPIETLHNVRKVLQQNGYLILSTPNANGWGSKFFKEKWVNWHVPYHIHFISKQSMRIAAEKSGFSIAIMKTITRSEWLTYQLAHSYCYPKEKSVSYFWDRRNSHATTYKRVILKMLIAGQYTMLGHGLTRFFDRMGVGDNYLIVLRKS